MIYYTHSRVIGYALSITDGELYPGLLYFTWSGKENSYDVLATFIQLISSLKKAVVALVCYYDFAPDHMDKIVLISPLRGDAVASPCCPGNVSASVY